MSMRRQRPAGTIHTTKVFFASFSFTKKKTFFLPYPALGFPCPTRRGPA